MLSYRTFQRLYDGDYEWILEEYTAKNDSLNEENLLVETMMNGYELYKRFDTALGLMADDGSGWKTKSNKLVDDHLGQLSDALTKIAQEFPEDERGYDEQSFKGGSASNFVDAVDTHLKDGKSWKQFDVKVDGEEIKLKFNQISKTNSLMGGISAAEKTARQECAAALALMMASDFADNPIPESVSFRATDLGKIDGKGIFVEKTSGIIKLKQYFTNMKSNHKDFDKRVHELEGLMGGKTFKDIAEFFVLDPSWINVIHNTARTANKSDHFQKTVKSKDKYDVHRGTKFMDLVYATYKEMAEKSNIPNDIIKNDKWNPGDVWMVRHEDTDFIIDILNKIKNGSSLPIKPSSNEKRIRELVDGVKKGSTALDYYNELIKKWYEMGVLKGISLKKFGGEQAEVKDYNDKPESDVKNIKVKFSDFRVNKSDPFASKDVYIDFEVEDDSIESSKTHKYAMQLRTFDKKIQAIQGEIKGTHANHGKVGMGVIRYLLGIKEGTSGSDFSEWRKILDNKYKKRTTGELDADDVASMGRSSIAKLSELIKSGRNSLRVLLVNRIIKLHNYVFPKRQVRRMMSKKDIMDEKKLPIDRIVSKLQALELCAWLRHIEEKRERETIKVDGEVLFDGLKIDAIMMRIYFYASSRGNIETNARSSKFMKLG